MLSKIWSSGCQGRNQGEGPFGPDRNVIDDIFLESEWIEKASVFTMMFLFYISKIGLKRIMIFYCQ